MLTEFRCQRCNKLLGKYRECQELEIKCTRCGLSNNLPRKVSSLAKKPDYSRTVEKNQA